MKWLQAHTCACGGSNCKVTPMVAEPEWASPEGWGVIKEEEQKKVDNDDGILPEFLKLQER